MVGLLPPQTLFACTRLCNFLNGVDGAAGLAEQAAAALIKIHPRFVIGVLPEKRLHFAQFRRWAGMAVLAFHLNDQRAFHVPGHSTFDIHSITVVWNMESLYLLIWPFSHTLGRVRPVLSLIYMKNMKVMKTEGQNMNATDRLRMAARARVLKAMAHPSRLLILEELSEKERCVNELTEMVGSDMSTVSKHLTVLQNTGLVQGCKRGTQVFYCLRVPCVLKFMDCVESVLKSNAAAHRACVK
jgi:ArsR family transcriptional regulator